MESLCFQIILILLLLVETALQSEYLVSQEFTTKTFADSNTWSYNRVYTCPTSDFPDFSSSSIMGILGKSEYQKKTFSGLPPHWSASVRFDMILMRSFDKSDNDHVEIYIDNVQYGSYDKTSPSEGYFMCSPTSSYQDALILYNKNITHTANSIEIKISPKTNEDYLNEGIGIKNFFLYLDLCDPSCLTCDGPSPSKCQTCPPNAKKTGTSCTCNDGFYQHKNSCVLTCPTGFVIDTNKCISNNCTGCTTCDQDNNICSKCNAGLYLYKGNCVNSCPYTAPLTSGICKDYDSTLINGQYLLNGLTSNNFGASEVLGMGFVLSGFQGNKDFSSSTAITTNCGTTHLLGGFYLSGVGASIQRSWTLLPPHWSIKVGFTLWKIDSWDDDSVFFYVDGTSQKQFKYSYDDGPSNQCGNHWNEKEIVYTQNFTHTSTSLSIKFTTNLLEDVSNESYGLRDFYLLVDFCTEFCTSCNQEGCLTCQSAYFMYHKKCYAICPIGSYQNSSITCADCDPTCQTCKSPGNICLTCNSPYFLNPGSTCLSTCPTSYWQKTSDRTCQQCHNSCYTCQSPGDQTSCLSCSGTLYLSNNQCIQTCPSDTYKNTVTNNNQCSACHSSCLTCDGPNSTNCLSCKLGTYYQQTKKTCVTICDSNQYADNTLIKCVNCESTCKTCSGPNSYNCLSCTSTLFFDDKTKTCGSTCPNGTYPNVSTNICSNCHLTCKTCTGDQSTDCQTCALPRYFQSTTKICDTACPSGYYKNDSIPACSKCESTCTTCSGGLATNCSTCSGTYFLDKTTNQCTTTCPAQTFNDPSNHECTSCSTNCLTCNGKNPTQCLSCLSPTFYQSSSNTCVPACNTNQYSVTSPARACQDCNTNCKTCSGPSNAECLSCSGTNFLNTTNHTCGSTCPDGTYKNTSSKECSACHGDCKTCSGPNNNQCLSCTLYNYFQASSSTCVTSCNKNQYKDDPIATCSSCNPSCASCNGNADNNCLSCAGGNSFLDKSTKTCVLTCPAKQYQNPSNNECTDCSSSCTTCNGGTSNNCLTCTSPLYFQSSTSSCDNNCLPNQYKSSTPTPQCLQCHGTCATCSGPSDSQCLSCSGTDLFLQDPTSGSSSCKQQCPQGTYKNSSNKQCSKCDQTCKTCSDAGSAKCQTCSYPRYFHSSTNECVLQCDAKQYKDDPTATCISCHSSCTTCSASSDTSCLSCSDSLFLNSTTHQCLNSCPDTQFKNIQNNKCTKCESSCNLCDGATKNDCLTCLSPLFFQSDTKSCEATCYKNQYKDPTGQKCSSCDVTCTTCSGKDANKCLSCSGSTYLNLVTNTCGPTCPVGTYKNDSNNQCSPCEASCKTCDNSSDTSCLSCSSPKLLQKSSHQCVTLCNSDQYADNSIPQCMQCHQSCLSCSGPTSDECTKCNSQTFLNPLTKQCVSNCPVGYYKSIDDNNCKKCDNSCHNCDGGSSSDCLDCALPLYYQPSLKKCVPSCNTNQYKDDSAIQCQQCNTECFSCSGGSDKQCTACDGLKYLDNVTSQCVTTCPDGKYKNNTNHICSDCQTTCKTCSGNLQTNCISCTLPSYYQPSASTCVLACQIDQYQDKSTATCRQCDPSCASCSGPSKNECSTCSGGLFLDSTTHQCVSNCPGSYYSKKIDNTCQKCDTSCKTCNDKFDSSCLTCDSPLYYHSQSSKCVSTCDPDQFKDDKQVQCVKCHAACKSCFGPSETECSSCPSTTFLNESQHNCINTCPDGQFQNKSNQNCTKCNPKCLTCSGGSDTSCLTCALPLYLQQSTHSCDSSCKQDQYSDDKDAQCKQCHSTCSSCTGPADTQCKTCSGSKYLQNNKCIDTCPDGMYAEKSDNTCQKCNSQCQNCDGVSSNNCLSCKPGQYLHQNECVTNCPDKLYKNSSTQKCSACSNQCGNCTDSTITSCLSCPLGYLLEESSCVVNCNSSYFQEKNSPKCTKCDSSCQTCSGQTENSCTSCVNQKYLQNGQCLSSCKDGTYADNLDNTCKDCHTTCLTCKGGSASQCNKCDQTRFFYNNTCMTQCPDGFYNDISNQNCSKCDIKCNTCISNSEKSCQSCQGTLFLYQNQCISVCPDGFFSDKSTNQCIQCNNVCQTCTSFTDNSCLTCKDGTFFSSNTCVNQCPKNTFGQKSSNTCEKCDSTCDSCNGSSTSSCLTCIGTKFEYQNQCVEICPKGYFKNNYNNTCQKCHESCESCIGDSSSQCTTCTNPLFLSKNSCLSACPVGQYKSLKTNSCESCDVKCQTCSGPTEKECISCKQGTILQETLCLKECSDGYYQNKEKQQCSKCHASCLTCTGPNNNQCQICPNLLMKYENSCIAQTCPSKTYLLQTPIRQCMDCDSICVSNCTGPSKEDCEAIKPQNQIIVIILCFKTVCWILSVFVGYLKDQKYIEKDKNKVVPSRINFDDLEVDSPVGKTRIVKHDMSNSDTTVNGGSPIPMKKQPSVGSPDKKNITLQQIDGNQQSSSQYFPSTFQDLNYEYNMTFQNQESPISKRKSRRTEFILRSRGNKHLFTSIQSSPQQNSPSDSIQNTIRGSSSSQVFDKLVPQPPTLASYQSSIFANGSSNKDKLLANQKLKFSILGNEWFSLFNFHDSSINRISRSTLIYLKYQMFFFICNHFSFVIQFYKYLLRSPLYYILACLSCGVGMKFIIGNLLALITNKTRFGNKLLMIIFISVITCDFYFWFVPTLISLKYVKDVQWSILYTITFSIDFLLLQQIFGLISYLCTVKYINEEKKEKSLNKYFKNNYLINKLKN